MTDKLLNLTGKTLIPISSLAVIVVSILWITEIKSEVRINSEKIKINGQQQNKILQKLDENTKKLDENTQKLSRIEGSLEYIKERIK